VIFVCYYAGKKFEIWVACEDDGTCPVEQFVWGLGHEATQRRAKNLLTTTADSGKYQNEELYKNLGDGIWEFKPLGVRLFSFDDERRVVLTHGAKKPKKREYREHIDKAKGVREQYFAWKEGQK
jgi:hypothetical protein